MREVKFRAWNKQLGEMADVIEISFVFKEMTLRSYDSTDSVDFGDADLMQYTGLKDKNGVEIYEGDLLKQRYLNKNIYEVVWRKSGFELKCDFIRKFEGDSWIESSFLPIHNDSYEVIGNIYEHPHLLKQEDPS